jgi:tetratricopeptide (TPR) repeat protein
MPSDNPIRCPPRANRHPRPGTLGMTCALVALATACGGDGGTARNAAPGTAASPAEAAPAGKLPPLDSLRVNSPDPTRSGADSDKRISQARASSQGKPEAIEARALLGAELYDGGRSAKAERVYRELLKQHPEHVGALVGLAQILIDRDDLDGAGAVIERALKANPESIPALQMKIAWLLGRDQAAEAVSQAESALRRAANSAALQGALGDAQRSYGDLPKAIEAYRKVVGLNPEWAPGWTRLGESLAQNGDAAEAQAALTRALERNPESYPAYRALARLYFDNGQPEQAVGAWERALHLQPDRGEAHEGMAEALLAARRPAEARRYAEEAQRRGRDVHALLQKIDRAKTP